MSRIVGQYAIQATDNERRPRWDKRSESRTFPEFQYAVDSATGASLTSSCDPDELGSYFDPDDSLLHHLTPVYFTPEVLARYVNEPSRYSVTASRLTCLDLWGVDISINTAGLVEVYLGDLGENVPTPELTHWLAHNVAPAGKMIEARFRRDFLNQPTAQDDPPGEMKRSYDSAIIATSRYFGSPLWKPLKGAKKSEFDHIFTPVSSDPYALRSPVIILCKVFVDSLDVNVMRTYLGEGDDVKKLRPLQLLERTIEKLGGEAQIYSALHNLSTLRSSGGIAHRGGTETDRVLERLGLEELNPPAAYNQVARNLGLAMRAIVSRIEDLGQEGISAS